MAKLKHGFVVFYIRPDGKRCSVFFDSEEKADDFACSMADFDCDNVFVVPGKEAVNGHA